MHHTESRAAALLYGIACMLAPIAKLSAQEPPARPDTAVTLSAVKITAQPVDVVRVNTMQLFTLRPTASVTVTHAKETINLVDPEDAVKYLPSLFIRKRNYGDTQATMATRVWGVSSSARSLVFADGVPISALVANNNTIGGPRWGLVSPEEIARIDVMYGPYSAAYAGNSMGAVMEITTRQPQSLEGSIEQTHALQRFSLYGTSRTFGTAQTNATLGDRFGKFSFWLSGNYQDSHAQPLLYVTSSTIPNGTNGAFAEENKLGAPANVLGATGLLHTGMTNGKLKLSYDLTPGVHAAYTLGYWHNDGRSGVNTYLESSGRPTFAGQAGFATGFYDLEQRQFAQSLSLRTDTRRDWDADVVAAWYRFDKDQQRFPVTASTSDTSFANAGRVAVLDGTGWSSIDLKGAWHRGGGSATHTVAFGAHQDDYHLLNPTYSTSDWRNGSFGNVFTEGDGKTRTQALWAQDTWAITPVLRFIVGGRYEWWRAYDGFNVNGGTQVVQPEVRSARFSPKAIVDWGMSAEWRLTASVAKAYRFATAAELYQLVSTGATFTSPDPHLAPDNDLSAELRMTRYFERGSAQLALFQDDVHDAIISQFLPLVPGSTTLYSYLANVDHVRARGVEATIGTTDLFVRGFDVSASATYLDARTLALSGRASATAPEGSAIGKFLPNIPRWRASFLGSYQPVTPLTLSLAGRYSDKMYTTLDNADVHPNTYQGFSEWFVMDARANYRVNEHWSAAVGVDNLLDRKYFLFHPFPQRTLVLSARFGL